MFTIHYNVNDVTKSVNVSLLLHATPGRESPLNNSFLSDFLSVEKFSVESREISSEFRVANWVCNHYHTQ